MGRLIREPLVHFLLGGALLFGLYGLVAGPGSGAPHRILVSEDRVAMLAQAFERTWMRPPTEAELRSYREVERRVAQAEDYFARATAGTANAGKSPRSGSCIGEQSAAARNTSVCFSM